MDAVSVFEIIGISLQWSLAAYNGQQGLQALLDSNNALPVANSCRNAGSEITSLWLVLPSANVNLGGAVPARPKRPVTCATQPDSAVDLVMR